MEIIFKRTQLGLGGIEIFTKPFEIKREGENIIIQCKTVIDSTVSVILKFDENDELLIDLEKAIEKIKD